MALPHVVFVPGLLCTADLFAHQTANLESVASCEVADTLRDATLGEMAERLLAKAPERFSLAGLSMGGYVAFEVLARAPERVDRLILIDTSARADREEQSQARRDLVALARCDGMRAAIDVLYPRIVAPAGQGDPELRLRIEAMADVLGVDGFARQQEAIIARPDSREDLRRLTLPTLVIVGAEDILTPPKLAIEMVERLARARLETVPDCGHMATMEQPEALTRLIASFLTQGN